MIVYFRVTVKDIQEDIKAKDYMRLKANYSFFL